MFLEDSTSNGEVHDDMMYFSSPKKQVIRIWVIF